MKKMAKIAGIAMVATFVAIGVVCTTIIMSGLIQELKEEEKLYSPWQE